MSCFTTNGASVGVTCSLTGEKKNVVRVIFIRKTFYAADIASSSSTIVLDSSTEDKAKNEVIAAQIALQQDDPQEATSIMWTGVIDSFALADPESEEFKVSKIGAGERVFTNRVLTFVDRQSYSPSEAVAGSIGSISKQDNIFTNTLPSAAKLAHHVNHKAIRLGAEACIVCFVTEDGMFYPIRDKQNDPVALSVSNFLSPEDNGSNSYWTYKYEIKGSSTVGDWFTESVAIPYSDFTVGTTSGANEGLLKLLYKL